MTTPEVWVVQWCPRGASVTDIREAGFRNQHEAQRFRDSIGWGLVCPTPRSPLWYSMQSRNPSGRYPGGDKQP